MPKSIRTSKKTDPKFDTKAVAPIFGSWHFVKENFAILDFLTCHKPEKPRPHKIDSCTPFNFPMQIGLDFYCFLSLLQMADAMEIMILSILSPALHCEWGIRPMQQVVPSTILFLMQFLSNSNWYGTWLKIIKKSAPIVKKIYKKNPGLLLPANGIDWIIWIGKY